MPEVIKKSEVATEAISAAIIGAVTAASAAAVTGLIQNLPKILLRGAKDVSTGSLIEYTKLTRVEPMVMLDESLKLQPFLPDVMESVVNIFCGYYLQAVAVSANVGNVEVKRLLKKLDPDRVRSPVDTALDLLSQRYHEGMEIYIDSLESPDNEGALSAKNRRRRDQYRKGETKEREQRMDRLRERSRQRKEDERKEREEGRKVREEKRKTEEEKRRLKTSTGVGRQNIDDFNTSANLSMGKLINVEIESDGRKTNIPVNVRLIVKPVPPAALTDFLTVIQSDRRARTRWKRWKSGEIEFFKDLVLCQDIIDEEKRAHYSDKTGIFKKIRERNRSKENNIYDIATGEINVATASSIIIISRDTANEVERAMMGKLDHFKTRENLFRITFTMIMIVIDVRWEKIVMYHKSIDEPSILSVKDFKSKSSGSGPDINEILMAYRAGTAPTF